MNTTVNNYEEETEEAPPPRGSRIVIWLVILSLGALFLPLYLVSTSIQDETQTLSVTLTAVQATLVFTPEPLEQELALQDTLAQLRDQVNALQPVIAGLVASQVDWLNSFAVIGSYDPTRITLNGIAQTENRLVLTGQATSEGDIMAYFQLLDESTTFDRVVVQSIVLREVSSSPATAKPIIRDAAPTEEIPAERISEFNILVELKVGTDE